LFRVLKTEGDFNLSFHEIVTMIKKKMKKENAAQKNICKYREI